MYEMFVGEAGVLGGNWSAWGEAGVLGGKLECLGEVWGGSFPLRIEPWLLNTSLSLSEEFTQLVLNSNCARLHHDIQIE